MTMDKYMMRGRGVQSSTLSYLYYMYYIICYISHIIPCNFLYWICAPPYESQSGSQFGTANIRPHSSKQHPWRSINLVSIYAYA